MVSGAVLSESQLQEAAALKAAAAAVTTAAQEKKKKIKLSLVRSECDNSQGQGGADHSSFSKGSLSSAVCQFFGGAVLLKMCLFYPSSDSSSVSAAPLPLQLSVEYRRLFAFFLADSCVRACCHGFQLSSGAVQRDGGRGGAWFKLRMGPSPRFHPTFHLLRCSISRFYYPTFLSVRPHFRFFFLISREVVVVFLFL